MHDLPEPLPPHPLQLKNLPRLIGKKFLARLLLVCWTLIPSPFSGNVWAITGKAEQIFEKNQHSVFQIQVIDTLSREKSTIGSGFIVSKEGLIATNYHVISDVLDDPENHHIEYHRAGKKEGQLIIMAIDIVHDLALLKTNERVKKPVTLSTAKLEKGAQVFPIGNPLDLGMVVLEGTYNGLLGDDPYQHILLSASLNPGMSGGPSFNTKGKVVGINVSIEGNDLSHLVPAAYLIQLIKNYRKNGPQKDWTRIIQNQIIKRYNHLITGALKNEWSVETFGHLKVPQKIFGSALKCWGKSRPENLEKENFYFYGYKWCQSDRNIYVSSDIYTGTIGYAFFWLESKSLNPLVLHQRLSEEFSKGHFYQHLSEDDVTDFKCNNHFVNFASQDWKAAYCVRRYKKYSNLNDIFLSFAMLGDTPEKFVIQVGLSGVNEPLTRKFLKKFLETIQWVE